MERRNLPCASNRPRAIAAALLAAGLPAAAAPSARVPTLPLPGPGDTIARAHFTRAELAEIVHQVAGTSFDTPDDVRGELRIRRIRLDGQLVLVVRGTNLLCGGTGGCETWVLQRHGGRWTDAIAGDAPVVDRIDLAAHRSHGRHDLMAGNGVSASREAYVVYAYDGDRYRSTRCFETRPDGSGAPKGGTHPCAIRSPPEKT